ncbi:hypothetical protein KI659_12315 [Litoribacter alkaliphilus]|uniref:tRNA (Guanine-N1)-methyltransferase n=1 Tax=Litoribacter ruber TaxID=702568 RepID=A0AAP2G4S0_9BACT|nr:hypothetical protein [Litoribacter alkaliphilus]MBS9524795.1 hypothetical protein [Litoribacter alkaliphilus]
MKKFNRLTLACCMMATVAVAQESEQEGSLNSGTISSQFEYLNSISNNYQEYKVVKKTNLDKIQKNITDSLDFYKVQIVDVQKELASQKTHIASLEQKMEKAEAEKNAAIEAKDNFAFLGMPIHKSNYNNLMWGIVAVLGMALLFFLYKFNKSHRVTAETLKTLDETKEEFEQHRKNTLERERKLNRQLVDEMNKRNVKA